MSTHTSPGFFVIRAPLYPFDAFLSWTRASHGRDDASLDADREQLRAELRAIVTRPEVREAVFVASPALEAELPLWLAERDTKRAIKIEYALLRYFSRLTARATPFGLFAGYGLGTVGDTTALSLEAHTRARRQTRLDHLYITRIADDLVARSAALRQRLRCRPGTAVYEHAERIRFAERETAPGGGVAYTLSSVAATDYLRATIESARAGATGAELAASLRDADHEISLDEAAAYIDQLFASGVLESELVVPITGEEPLAFLIRQLARDATTAETSVVLERAARALADLDRAGIGRDPSAYRAIASDLAHLPHEHDLSRLFQVDLGLPVRAMTLGTSVLHEIDRGIAALVKMSIARPPRVVRQFASDFEARYGDREVPLLEALDEDSGVPFGHGAQDVGLDPSPLLHGMGFPPAAFGREWQVRDVQLLQRLIPALRDGATELVLGDADIDELARNEATPLVDSVSVLAAIAASSAEAIDRGDYRVLLQMVVGSTALRFMARFAHGDPVLTERLREIAAVEAACQPDAVIAELVHVPEGRVGNIVARPLLREHEIPFLGRSGAPVDHQIALDDLVVSVASGRVRLRSRRLGREVIPRNSTAFKYTSRTNVAIYAFLSSIQQRRGLEAAQWEWGPLYDSPYLPRVRYGKCVLYRAQWYLDGRELERLAALRGAERFRKFQSWRTALRLPRLVTLEEGDSTLAIDLENVLCVEMLLDYCKRRRRIRVLEMYPGPDELCADSPEGRFVHELVIPLVARPTSTPASSTASPTPAAPAHVARTLPPGSSWAYGKLYASPSQCDAVLCEEIAPLLERAEGEHAIDGWFFIRYADPAHHLRVRFHGPERVAVAQRVERLAADLIERGLVWRFQWDTYEREHERYGGERAIEHAEQVFHADSLATVAILETLRGAAGADARWRLCVLGIDRLLDDLKLDLAGKHALADATAAAFARELDVAKTMKQDIDRRFRDERASLEQLLARRPGDDHVFAPAIDAFAQRSALVESPIARLSALAAAGELTTPWPALAQSFVHMHANRMIRSSPRAHELLLYGFLARLYRSQQARVRSAQS